MIIYFEYFLHICHQNVIDILSGNYTSQTIIYGLYERHSQTTPDRKLKTELLKINHDMKKQCILKTIVVYTLILAI